MIRLACCKPRSVSRISAARNLSARSIQFGIAVAPSLPQRLQRVRGAEGRHRGVVGPIIHIDRALVAAVHIAKRNGTDWFVIPGHADKLGTYRQWNQVTVIGSRKRTNVALSD